MGVGRVAAVRSRDPPLAKSLHPHPQAVNFLLDGAHQLVDLLDPLQEEAHAGLGGGLLRRVLVVHRHDRPGQSVVDDAELRAVDAVPQVAVGAFVGQVVLNSIGTEDSWSPSEIAVDTREVLGRQRDELVGHGLFGRVGIEAGAPQHHEVVVALDECGDRHFQFGDERVLFGLHPDDRLTSRDDVTCMTQSFAPGVTHAGELLGEDLSAELLHLLDVPSRRTAVEGDGGVSMCDGCLDGFERAVGADLLGAGSVSCERRGCNDCLIHFVLPGRGRELLTHIVPRYNNIFLRNYQFTMS